MRIAVGDLRLLLGPVFDREVLELVVFLEDGGFLCVGGFGVGGRGGGGGGFGGWGGHCCVCLCGVDFWVIAWCGRVVAEERLVRGGRCMFVVREGELGLELDAALTAAEAAMGLARAVSG